MQLSQLERKLGGTQRRVEIFSFRYRQTISHYLSSTKRDFLPRRALDERTVRRGKTPPDAQSKAVLTQSPQRVRNN